MTKQQMEAIMDDYAERHAHMGLRDGSLWLLQYAMVGRGEDMRCREEKQIRWRVYESRTAHLSLTGDYSFQVLRIANAFCMGNIACSAAPGQQKCFP